MKVFVSSQSVDGAPAAALLAGLRRSGIEVEHSPRNPLDGNDDRWSDWYDSGLPAALARCDLFVAVIDHVWDSSTWMACEADVAMKQGSLPVLFWNPNRISVTAKGMLPYLREELPVLIDDAIEVLLRRGAR